MEADPQKRKEYLEKIKDMDVTDLVYIDESGFDINISKERGWSRKGEILYGSKSGKYYERTNIIAALHLNFAIAPMIFNGSCNTKVFNKWVEDILVKELRPGQTIIMDNASFHKSEKTKQLIESAGCNIIFLPPYSRS